MPAVSLRLWTLEEIVDFGHKYKLEHIYYFYISRIAFLTGELCIQETEFDTSGKLEVIAIVEKIIRTVFSSLQVML